MFTSHPSSSLPPRIPQKTPSSPCNNLRTFGTKPQTPRESAAGDVNIPSAYINVASYITESLKFATSPFPWQRRAACDSAAAVTLPSRRDQRDTSSLTPLSTFLPGELINL